MKIWITAILALMTSAPMASFADETMGEKMEAQSNNAKRSMRKSANRMKEHMCAEGDAKCAAKKARHRGEEAKDSISDKADELGNKVD